MPQSRARKQSTDRRGTLVIQPHLKSPADVCTHCRHRWPCSSAVAGEDLPSSLRCTRPDGWLADVYDPARLSALSLVEDSGRRRRVGGRLHILWSITSTGRLLAPEMFADLERHGQAPSDEDRACVLMWLDMNLPSRGTRQSLAVQCAEALECPSALVERCLLWGEVNGFVQGPATT